MKVKVNVFENVLAKGNYFATINSMDGKELCRFSYDNEVNALLETIKSFVSFESEKIQTLIKIFLIQFFVNSVLEFC